MSSAEEDELMMRKRVPISASMSKLASMDNVAHVVAPVAAPKWLGTIHRWATVRESESVTSRGHSKLRQLRARPPSTGPQGSGTE